MPVTLDPDSAAVYKAFQEAGRPAYETLTPSEAREFYLQARTVTNPEPPELKSVAPLSIPSPSGAIPARIYTPIKLRQTNGLAPCLVFFHGGGGVSGDLDSHDVVCRKLAHEGELIVISVDYRLAPEHKFPAGIEDCLYGTRWAATHAAELGANPMRIAVAGDSAGANMAAVTALRVRDEGGPTVCGQLLLYPVTDYHTPGTPSYEENAEGYGLTRDTMQWFWAHYLSDDSEGRHPHASPLRAPDVSGLPPALVITAEYDPLRDEGEFYAERLKAARVPTALSRYLGVNHGFMFWVGVVAKAGAAMNEACEWLRGVFAGPR
jgi:acetyl esterase